MPLKSFLALSAIFVTFCLSLERFPFKVEASSEPALWFASEVLLSAFLVSALFLSLFLLSEPFLSSVPSVN